VVNREPETPSGTEAVVEARGFDEMLDDAGDLRDHWRYVMGSLRLLGGADLADRQAEVDRLLHQDGAAHDSTSGLDGGGPGRLDLIPLLMSSEDWSVVEAGLVQRAELLDLVLSDIYGPQELLHRGIIPVEVVHAHQGYIRPVHGDTTRGEYRLVHYSAELARGDDGSLVVLGDRTRIPTGTGYALEHRLVLSRVFPSLFRDAHVHRLAHFFRGLRRGLIAIAPSDRDDPRIVILTPGPSSPTYFEHSYLASYLGYPLVEPADLTVRRGRVWLRSLDGLQQVDVIVRGISDERCDPLELRPGAGVGVPGLIEAARRGTVAIANPVGSAVVENPGLLPFLPAVAEHLLGVPLLLDSIETWWCGRAADLERVIDDLESLVLVPIDGAGEITPVVGATLTGPVRDNWINRIRREPFRWVGQHLPNGGWVPSLTGDRIESRPYSIRAFLMARDGSYVAMPGGLGRIPASGAADRVPHPADPPESTLAKDLWVLASEPERPGTSLLSDTVAAAASGGPLVQPSPPTIAGSLPSRTAENLFWFGRYAERAEQVIRWSRTVLTRATDTADQDDTTAEEWLGDLMSAMTAVIGSGGAGIELQPNDDPTVAVVDALFP
jgi:uncharacterized circularly permuted ATP-grasp superfamily protein